MKVEFPPLWALHQRYSHLGYFQQMELPSVSVSCTAVPYRREKDKGHQLLGDDGNLVAYLFSKRPKTATFDLGEPVVIAGYETTDVERLDLSGGTWISHPSLQNPPLPQGRHAAIALESWRGGFRFIEGDTDRDIIGLRPPQIGAIHAVLAHWSVSSEAATIVMPTGTGKTETMLGILIAACCPRVLVVVPTDPLRTQLASKFVSLGIFRDPRCPVLSDAARRPVVGVLESRPDTDRDVDSLLMQSNVVVTTNALLAGCLPDIQARIAELCSHLFIDEAHHAEAGTWKAFRQRFSDKHVLQFTATPFREDKQKVDGKIVYNYPLQRAQEEGYFKPIRFRPVYEYDSKRGDQKIVEAAVDELAADRTGRHIVMARVDGISRANEILEMYQQQDRYTAVLLHSKLPRNAREESRRKLLTGEARIVVCVDMLGEGFDLPELKIAALHDVRKSLAVTLQLAGRFTRARRDLGDPVFIANTALIEVADELRSLYSQDPDWNVIVPELSKAAIDEEIAAQEFFRGFGQLPKEVPLQGLHPAASMVVYRTQCADWTPRSYFKAFRGLGPRDRLYPTINEEQKTLVVIAAIEKLVRWSDSELIQELIWELLIAVWDRERGLLYVHGSNIDGTYRDFARAVCGTDVELLRAPTVFRSFAGVRRLTLSNVGLNEFLGRQVRYTGRMGSDVEARIGQAVRQGSVKAVISGQGFENGARVSVGAAKGGRIWAHLRLRVDTFSKWAKAIGAKLDNDGIDPDVVLAGTLKPTPIGETPQKVVIGVDWPVDVLERPEQGTQFSSPAEDETAIAHVEIEAAERSLGEPITVRVHCEKWESQYRLSLFAVGDSFDFKFELVSGERVRVRHGRAADPLEDYFTNFPPVIWFSDGSSLTGCEYVELPPDSLQPFAANRLVPGDWGGIDITKESQGESRDPTTVQFRVIEMLLNDDRYEIVFDDDGSGEAADVLGIYVQTVSDRKVITIDLFHCKFSGGAPGARIDDLYVVCGQAQRSTSWMANHERRTELFAHLLRREVKRTDANRASRFQKGNLDTLRRLYEMSRRCEVRLTVTVVQPGLSAKAASRPQLLLLAVTERYLSDTYEIPFKVICSE